MKKEGPSNYLYPDMLKFMIFIMAITSCSKKAQPGTSDARKLVEMSKSPCFGFCPVYHLVIYENGMMRLNAKQNMKITGTYSKQLNPAQLNTIKSGLEKMKLEAYQDEYREPVADAPSTEVIYYADNTMKKIFTNFIFPEPLQKMTDDLNQHALSENWLPWTDPRIRNEFIVLLQDGISLSGILTGYREYELMMVKRLDPANRNYWLLSAMVNPGEESILLNKLKNDPGIKEVQLNRSLDTNR